MQSAARLVSIIGLLQAAAILTLIFSLLTAVDTSVRGIELFAHFRLQYFVASVLLLLIFAVLKQPLDAGVLLLIAVFNASFVVGWYAPHSQLGGGQNQTQLKLMHANVYSSNSDYQRLLDLVASENPDMVFLQEVTPEWFEGTKSLKQDYPHAYSAARAGSFGIAVYSRIPFDSVQHVNSPPLGYPTIVATTTVRDKTLTLISSHPTIPVNGRQYAARNTQLDSLAELIRGTPGEVALIGDLNASTWDPKLHKLSQVSGLRNARQGFGILPTWPTFLPFAMIPIDHVLVSENVAVVDMQSGRGIGSDHLPLLVTLSL